MDLYPHNQEAYEAVMQHFDSGQKRAAVVHATGTGKSYIIGAVASHYGKCLVIAPNNFVLNETRKVCHEGVEFRTYASVMYDEEPSTYELIVLDEFHRSGAEKWGAGVQRLLDANPDACIFGTSATHIRYLDGMRNMADELFDGNIVSQITLKDALDKKILPYPTYVCSLYSVGDVVSDYSRRIETARVTQENKEKLRRRLSGIAHNWESAGGVSAIISKYFHQDTRRIIVFCPNVFTTAVVRVLLDNWLSVAGYQKIRFYHINYESKTLEQDFRDFESSMDGYDIKVAISVNMLNEGVHVPGVDGIIMMRGTVSRIIMEQQIGRCLTSGNYGKSPVILDLVNNMDNVVYGSSTSDEPCNSTGGSAGRVRPHYSLPFKVIDECRDVSTALASLDELLPSRQSHTKEVCMASAARFKTRKEWAKGDNIFYQHAYRHGWLDECCAHMTPGCQSRTKEECMASAARFKTRKEWKKGDIKLYSCARKHKWLDECCAHMTPGCQSRTKEECMASAARFKTRKEWVKGDRIFYQYACHRGWLDECCAHMTPIHQSRTKEECIASAARFKTRKEWEKGDHAFYIYACRRGWLDECCAHMVSGRGKKRK